MAVNSAYSIAVEDQDVIVRFREDVLDRAAISKFLDYLELESIRRRSALSEGDADTISSEIDQAMWNRTRPEGLS